MRTNACNGQKIAGGKMKSKSAKRFGEAKVLDSVLVPVPDVDRGRLEALNLLAIVMSVDNGVYQLGTCNGILDQKYTRNQFNPCIEKFMDIEDMPKNKTICVRSAAKEASFGNGQGMLKCFCTGKCLNKKCKCKKHGTQCNSRCHNSGPCSNK